MTTTLLDRPALDPTSIDQLTVRPGRITDTDELWRIFAPVIASAETYAMPPETSREDAIAYWTANDGPWFVAELAGAVVGACMIHPNQPGLGRTSPTPPSSSTRRRAATTSAALSCCRPWRRPGRWATERCSSTSSWRTTTPRSTCTRAWASASSPASPKRSTGGGSATSTPSSSTGRSDTATTRVVRRSRPCGR